MGRLGARRSPWRFRCRYWCGVARRSLVLALVMVATYAGYASGSAVGGSVEAWIALNVALYTVAAHCPWRRALAGAGLVGAFTLAFLVPALVEGAPISGAAGEAVVLGGVWWLGRWVRRRRHVTADLEQHAATLEADRADIARLLHVSEETVKTHASRIFMKLGVRDRTQAVILAYEHGIIQPGTRS
jgi:Bacterial regulatory proteins, luxR family